MKQKLFLYFTKFGLWRMYAVFFRLRKKKKASAQWVFGRVACMGIDTYQLIDSNLPLVNIQKGRADYIVSVNNGDRRKARIEKIVSFIPRNDIKELILQQELADIPFKKAPELIYIDSYSELTDQLFVAEDMNCSFCANYNDVDNSFIGSFKCEGLLSVDRLTETYRNFFLLLRSKYGRVPIIFMHFPIKLEKRESFRIRYRLIREAVESIRTEFLPFDVFEAPAELVGAAEDSDDDFPYHYSKATYQYLKKAITQNYFKQ